MGNEKNSRIPREQLLRWLDSGDMQLRQEHPGQESVHLIKLPRTEDIDYINGLSGGIALRGVLYFCGVYFHSSKTLRLANFIFQETIDGLTPEECADPRQLAQMLTDQVNAAAEAMIGDDRTRLDIEEVTSPELQLELDRYLKFGARQDAAHSFLSRSKPDGRFRSSYETSVVTVTVQDQRSTMTLQLPADSLAGYRDHVDWAAIGVEDRLRFWEAFGLRPLEMADISQIGFGGRVLYKVPVEQVQDTSAHHTMGGMDL